MRSCSAVSLSDTRFATYEPGGEGGAGRGAARGAGRRAVSGRRGAAAADARARAGRLAGRRRGRRRTRARAAVGAQNDAPVKLHGDDRRLRRGEATGRAEGGTGGRKAGAGRARRPASAARAAARRRRAGTNARVDTARAAQQLGRVLHLPRWRTTLLAARGGNVRSARKSAVERASPGEGSGSLRLSLTAGRTTIDQRLPGGHPRCQHNTTTCVPAAARRRHRPAPPQTSRPGRALTARRR